MTSSRYILVLVLLLAAPLAAQDDKSRNWESSFGANVLAQCDVIIYGIASAQRGGIEGAISVDVTVQEVIHGEEKSTEIKVLFNDPKLLPERQAAEAIFALKRMGGSGYSNVGTPEIVKTGDEERDARIAVLREYIKLEAEPEGAERTKHYIDLVEAQLERKSFAAQSAAVELKQCVQRRPELIDSALFERFEKASKGFTKTPKVMADLLWALGIMVEKHVKSDQFKLVRRGKTAEDKTKALAKLSDLVRTYGPAFTEADAKLCDALQKQDGLEASHIKSLDTLAQDIRNYVERERLRREAALQPKTETRGVDPGPVQPAPDKPKVR